jgi:hypothetical protein
MAVIGLAVLLSACGGSGGPEGVTGKSITALPKRIVPSQVLGLTVDQEDVSKALAQVRRTYVDATSVFSFRDEELLQATLQVSRFSHDARFRSAEFRRTLVNQIGGSNPTPVRVGSRDVFLTTGNRQRIAVWFRDRYMFVLATREDFERPRTLLRSALRITP